MLEAHLVLGEDKEIKIMK